MNQELRKIGITEDEEYVINKINQLLINGKKTGQLYSCYGSQFTNTKGEIKTKIAFYICKKQLSYDCDFSLRSVYRLVDSVCKKNIFKKVISPYAGFDYYEMTTDYLKYFPKKAQEISKIPSGRRIWSCPPRYRTIAKKHKTNNIVYRDFDKSKTHEIELKKKYVHFLKLLMKREDNEKSVADSISYNGNQYHKMLPIIMRGLLNMNSQMTKDELQRTNKYIDNTFEKNKKLELIETITLKYFYDENVYRIKILKNNILYIKPH